MSTIDITQVAGLQAVNAEGNVIGTLSVDDLTNLVANNLVKSTQNQVVAARSVSTMSEASTLAASDDYENTLPIDANPASVRTLDADGNPKQTGISALAQVVGELIGFNVITTPKFRGAYAGNVDDIKNSGLYVLVNGHTGSPSPNSYSLLEIITSGVSGITGYKIMRWYAKGFIETRQRIIFETYDSGWYRINYTL